MNGPVPTGLVLVNLSGFAIDAHRCSGTIGTCETVAANGTLGALKVTVTLSPEAVTLGHLRPDAGGVEGRVLLQQVEREDHIRGGEGLSVAPLDAGPDRVDQRRRAGELVTGGEERRVGAVDRARDLQRLVDQPSALELRRRDTG